ncbi:MAG TPA: putative porin [Woeseiaceae bacterium]|nr:putative porin [Woeseiaceae bacterium]
MRSISLTSADRCKRSNSLSLVTSILVVICVLAYSGLSNAAEVATVELHEKIDQLEAALKDLQDELSALRAQADKLQTSASAVSQVPARTTATAPESRLPSPARSDDNRLDVAGDFRLRYENTSAHAGLPDRNRGVLRGRLGAAYKVTDALTAGARLTTGDPGDPNTADVTMGDFVNDLDVSLDQAYIAYRFGNHRAVGGKFSNPFKRTDLVWDGDVNPYGAAAHFNLLNTGGSALSLTAIYSIIDEQVIRDDSDMLGAQLSLDTHFGSDLKLGLSAAYYDYDIGSLANADLGDIRGNNLAPGGTAYLSDFNLFDVVATVEYTGIGEAWPLLFTGDYVKNTGAAVPEDTGYRLQFGLRQLAEVGDWRIRYGYSMAQTDAVLAAFSNDNITYATNYRLHALTVDYMLAPHTFLDLTAYRYKRDDFSLVMQPGSNDYVDRIRFNMYVEF